MIKSYFINCSTVEVIRQATYLILTDSLPGLYYVYASRRSSKIRTSIAVYLFVLRARIESVCCLTGSDSDRKVIGAKGQNYCVL